MLKNNYTQCFQSTNLLLILHWLLVASSLVLLVTSVTIWDGVCEPWPVIPSEELSTMNLYFFQLRTFTGSLTEFWGETAPRIQLLDSAGEFGWQSDLRGLWGPLVCDSSMFSIPEFTPEALLLSPSPRAEWKSTDGRFRSFLDSVAPPAPILSPKSVF